MYFDPEFVFCVRKVSKNYDFVVMKQDNGLIISGIPLSALN